MNYDACTYNTHCHVDFLGLHSWLLLKALGAYNLQLDNVVIAIVCRETDAERM